MEKLGQRIFEASAIGIVGIAAFVYLYQIDLFYAWTGQSPIEWVYRIFFPARFANDFPDITLLYNKSLFMQIYLWAYAYLKIPPEASLYVVVVLEVLLLSIGFFWLTRALLPEAPKTLAYVVLLLVIASSARNMNLARFAQPFVCGLYYNFTDFMRIGAIVFFLKRSYNLGAVMLAVAFMAHPALGLMGAVFCYAIALGQSQAWKSKTLWISAILFSTLAGFWYWRTYGSSGLAAGGIPESQWYAFSRFSSYHWFSTSEGMFRGERYFIAFFSFCLLLSVYFPEQLKNSGLPFGFIAVLAMSLVGIVASVYELHPLIVKMALLRSNDLIIIIGLPIVANGLWQDIGSKNLIPIFLALFIGLTCFFQPQGFPLLFCIAVATIHFLSYPSLPRAILPAAGLLAMGAMLLKGINPFKQLLVVGPIPFSATLILFFLVLLAYKRSSRIAQWIGSYSQNVAALLFVLGSLFWLSHKMMSPEQAKQLADYKEVQLWAKENTKDNSVFMVDPSIDYGWRTYSQRSSFGCLREWLFTGWFYNADISIFNMGQNRFKEFGLDLKPYFTYLPDRKGYYLLKEAIHKEYYKKDAQWKKTMASKYGIQYFVLEKAHIRNSPSLDVAYENDHFLVLKTPQAKPNSS